MKRIITWGIRYEDFDIQRELFSLMAEGNLSIVAETAFVPDDNEIFYCRYSLKEALLIPHDYIICSDNDLDEAKKCLRGLGKVVEVSKLRQITDFASPRNKEILDRQVRIIKELVTADDEQIANRDWMSERIFDYGTYPFFKLVKTPQIGVTYSSCGILQVPDEFIDFCMFISSLKCENAIEIGVARGGSSYVMAALLNRNNPDLVYDMVDINDSLVNYEEMKNLIPALNKRIPSTSNDYNGKAYDFCFIDADHSYSAVMEDYRNVGQYSRKITAFHDVFGHEYDGLDGGTVRGWKEIKQLANGKEVREFSKFPDKWMGIGVVVS